MGRAFVFILFSCVLIGASGLIEVNGKAGSVPPGSVPPDSLRNLFIKANKTYAGGDYEKSAELYEKLAALGVNDKDLFYNLGNAYYKSGLLGKAILFYERAERLAPRDKDIKKNIKLVRSFIKDKQFVKKEIWIAKPFVWLSGNLNLNESILLSSILYLLLCVLVIGFIFMESRFIHSLHSVFLKISPGRLLGLMPRQDFAMSVLVVLALFLASSAMSAGKIMEAKKRDDAVIIKREVLVYSAPNSDSTLEFKIHEGTKVRIQDANDGWLRISLPGGLSGWIAAGSAESI